MCSLSVSANFNNILAQRAPKALNPHQCAKRFIHIPTSLLMLCGCWPNAIVVCECDDEHIFSEGIHFPYTSYFLASSTSLDDDDTILIQFLLLLTTIPLSTMKIWTYTRNFYWLLSIPKAPNYLEESWSGLGLCHVYVLCVFSVFLYDSSLFLRVPQ